MHDQKAYHKHWWEYLQYFLDKMFTPLTIMAILFHPASQNINPQSVVSSLVSMMIGKLNFGLDKPCTGPMEYHNTSSTRDEIYKS